MIELESNLKKIFTNPPPSCKIFTRLSGSTIYKISKRVGFHRSNYYMYDHGDHRTIIIKGRKKWINTS